MLMSFFSAGKSLFRDFFFCETCVTTYSQVIVFVVRGSERERRGVTVAQLYFGCPVLCNGDVWIYFKLRTRGR